MKIKKKKKEKEPEWSKYWPNLDSQLQASGEETEKLTDGELFLIEHIAMQFYKGGKNTQPKFLEKSFQTDVTTEEGKDS